MAARRRNARKPQPTLGARLGGLARFLPRLVDRVVMVAALAAIGVLALLAVEALRAVPVERIVVSGKLEHLRQEAVRDALAGELGDGLLVLDLPALRERLERLPWVYRAELRRRFPGTLEVRVVEQVPIARWGDDAFLNHEARVIEVVDATRWAKLPEIRGPEGSEARLMRHYQQLRLDLAPIALRPVALREDDFGQLRATLDNGAVIELGDHAFRGRVQRLVKLWTRELAQAPAPVRRVDLRYERGAAVAFAELPPEGIEQDATERGAAGQVAALINTREDE
jgi:cell division protein FtsQ